MLNKRWHEFQMIEVGGIPNFFTISKFLDVFFSDISSLFDDELYCLKLQLMNSFFFFFLISSYHLKQREGFVLYHVLLAHMKLQLRKKQRVETKIEKQVNDFSTFPEKYVFWKTTWAKIKKNTILLLMYLYHKSMS
mgnify:CR=1 FL=1